MIGFVSYDTGLAFDPKTSASTLPSSIHAGKRPAPRMQISQISASSHIDWMGAMAQDNSASLVHTIDYLERCLVLLSEVALASSDLAFLQTFLTHAKGYLSGDLSPDTEAMANWYTPENQAMIRRYITHVEAEIRLVIEEWQQTHPDELHTASGIKLQDIVTDLECLHHTPSNLTERPGRSDVNETSNDCS